MTLNSELAATLKRVQENDPTLTSFCALGCDGRLNASEEMCREYFDLLVPALARNTVIRKLFISIEKYFISPGLSGI